MCRRSWSPAACPCRRPSHGSKVGGKPCHEVRSAGLSEWRNPGRRHRSAYSGRPPMPRRAYRRSVPRACSCPPAVRSSPPGRHRRSRSLPRRCDRALPRGCLAHPESGRGKSRGRYSPRGFSRGRSLLRVVRSSPPGLPGRDSPHCAGRRCRRFLLRIPRSHSRRHGAARPCREVPGSIFAGLFS